MLEMNIAALNLSDNDEDVWLSSLPPISGVILCYDSTRQETLQGLDATLGETFPSTPPTKLNV